MIFQWLEISVTLSSLFFLLLVYKRPANNFLWQLILALLLACFFLFKRFFAETFNASLKAKLKWILVLLLTFLIQTVIFTTGSLFSPFLILVHLFFLATAFFLNRRTALIFLFSTMLIVVGEIKLNPLLYQFFLKDPWAPTLYIASFIAIIPLSNVLTRYYYLKDRLVQVLKREIHLKESREKSIFMGLKDRIVVINRNFQVVSFNQSFKEMVNRPSSEIILKPLFEILRMKSESGEVVDAGFLNLNKVLVDKTSRIIEGVSLDIEESKQKGKVLIQVRPIFGLKGEVEQVILMISEEQKLTREQRLLRDLEIIRLRSKSGEVVFKRMLQKLGVPELIIQAELLHQLEEDLVAVMELELGYHKMLNIVNLSHLCTQILAERQNLAQSLNVKLHFSSSDEIALKEKILFPRGEKVFTPDFVSTFKSQIFVNKHWATTFLNKLLEMAIFLASDRQNSTVNLRLLSRESYTEIFVTINGRSLSSEEQKCIFEINYCNELKKESNLHLGSGLEGYLLKRISQELYIDFVVRSYQNPPRVVFSARFNKTLLT